MLEKFEIGICTRNRWNNLYSVLNHIRNFGWENIRVIIYDDASDEPCPFNPISILPCSSITRFDQRAGLVVRRNQLAYAMQAPYYLSLDDDSFPVSGSIDSAIQFLQTTPSVLAVGFSVLNPGCSAAQPIRSKITRTQAFIGCAHIINRRNFMALGGYDESLIHQGEESDLAADGFKFGLSCFYVPGLIIQHDYSLVSRSWSRMAYFGGRNKIIWLRKHAPNPTRKVKIFRALIERIICAIRFREIAHLQGGYHGVFTSLIRFKHSTPMTLKQYNTWRVLPHV